MTALAMAPATARADLRGWLAEPTFAAVGVVLALAALPLLSAGAVDGGLFQGIDIWSKPLKFALALAIYVFTLSVYARWLPTGTTARRWFRVYVGTVAFAIAYEMTAISGAAALGTASHFNEATALSRGIYIGMGVFAVHLTGASLVYAVLIARSDRAPRDPALKLGLVLGLGLTFVLTLVIAGFMGQHGSHFVGGAGSDAGGLAVMGWARDGGDLRVAHFFGTHALHAVPLAGFVAGRVLPARPAVLATWASAAIWVAFCLAAFAQALDGRPFLPMLG